MVLLATLEIVVDKAWLNETVAIDPLMREPFDMHVPKASRLAQSRILLRQLGFTERMESYDAPKFADSTFGLAFQMIDNLIDVRERNRPRHLPSVADWVAGVPQTDSPLRIDRVSAAQAMLDLGWGHEHLDGGSLRDMLNAASVTYSINMSKRVLFMLRNWQRDGWISSVE